MTTQLDAAAGKAGRLKRVFLAVAWGPAIGGVLVGVVLGTGYSFFNRLGSAPPVELAASVDERPVVGTPAIVPVVAPVAKPMNTADLRDTSLHPIVPPTAGASHAGGFRSIATLSAPPSRIETEVRALKGESSPIAVGDALPPDERARPAVRADAVAAVWGFLAVGLGGTTAAASPPRSNIRQPR